MKLSTKEDLKELKAKINIKEVVRSLGVSYLQDAEWLGQCPACKAEYSFAIDRLRGKAYCFECCFHGDVIDLMMIDSSVSFNEAVASLTKMIDVRIDYQEPKKKESVSTLEEQPLVVKVILEQLEPLFEAIARHFEDVLQRIEALEGKEAIEKIEVKDLEEGFKELKAAINVSKKRNNGKIVFENELCQEEK